MTPLQALLAYASPDAPFSEFAGYVESGLWPIAAADDQGEGLLSVALEAARYKGEDANLIPFVGALINACARLPPSPQPGQRLTEFQSWRAHLPGCGLLINLVREATPISQANNLIAVLGTLSASDPALAARAAQGKASSLSNGDPGAFWSSRVQGLSMLSFMAATCLTAPPCGIHPGKWSKKGEFRAKALTKIIKSFPDDTSTTLENLLCQLLVGTARKPPSNPTPRDLGKMAWNRLALSADQPTHWVRDVCAQVDALPPLSRAQSCCAIIDQVSDYASQDITARALLVGLLPVVSTLQAQQMRALATESDTLSTLSALRGIIEQLNPAQDMTLALHAWIATSKVSMPTLDRRAFASRILADLPMADLPIDVLTRALADVEFTNDLDTGSHGALRAIVEASGLDNEVSRPTSLARDRKTRF